ncbi:MAG: SDR family oxidoreductase [Flavobacteriaceae bacterium]|jgi:nucleoside-diphosphate-sugar epimerase|nr:SDR family oxidoreductase [Flavobacteriaceae bacterium]
MSHLLCFGTGFVARRLAAALKGEGWMVSGTSRNPAKHVELHDAGIDPVAFDGTAALGVDALDGVTHILLSIPPAADGDPVFIHQAESLADLKTLNWVGYLSATSVYGDTGGALVDEGAPLLATTERGKRRIEAERDWLSLFADQGMPVHVFRLAGIYGPGRSALDQLRAGSARRISAPGHLFSRIHVDDIVAILIASMATARPGAVYNVCDDEPAESADVTAFAAELLGVEPPPLVPLEEADLTPMARSFYADNRLIDNRCLKRELDIDLLYPDYRAGLRAILAHSVQNSA